jgi:hypothetical protein
MDHGFAPGITDFDLQWRNLLAHRKTAALDTKPYPPPAKLRTIANLWSHLSTTAARPISDVVLVSHGNEAGEMVIKLVRGGFDKTTYDDLMRIQGDPMAAVDAKLPEVLRKTPPNGPLQPIKIHIRGCRIGEDVKFMNRLQDVLGDKVAVTAPRYVAGILALLEGKRHVIDPPSHGYAECLMYEFQVKAKTAFKTRAPLVDAFKKKKFPFVDGKQVPDALWDKWVPLKTFNAAESPILIPPLSLGAIISSTNPAVVLPKLKTAWFDGTFEHYPFYQPVAISLAAEPKPSDHRQLILDELRKDQMFSRADHPFFEPLGFPTLEKFVDAMTWAPTWSEKTSTLNAIGRMEVYAAQIQLCDPTIGDKAKPESWQLMYNFYPLRTLPLAPIEKLFVTDPTLFFTAVP